ncbi:MAG: hypothetical protein V8T87_03995 [Victivallales bacterium]
MDELKEELDKIAGEHHDDAVHIAKRARNFLWRRPMRKTASILKKWMFPRRS